MLAAICPCSYLGAPPSWRHLAQFDLVGGVLDAGWKPALPGGSFPVCQPYLRLPKKVARSVPMVLLTTDGCAPAAVASKCIGWVRGITCKVAAPAALPPNGDAGAAMAAPGTEGRFGTACCKAPGCGWTSIAGAASGAAGAVGAAAAPSVVAGAPNEDEALVDVACGALVAV